MNVTIFVYVLFAMCIYIHMFAYVYIYTYVCIYVWTHEIYTQIYVHATVHKQTYYHWISHKFRQTNLWTRTHKKKQFVKKIILFFSLLTNKNAWNPGSQTLPRNVCVYIYIYIYISLTLSTTLQCCIIWFTSNPQGEYVRTINLLCIH